MGVYSELDLEQRYGDDPFTEDDPFVEDKSFVEVDTPAEDNPFAEDDAPTQGGADDMPAPEQAKDIPADQPPVSDNGAAQPAVDKAADEDAKRKAHEEAEVKRKAEWETKQAQKKADEQKKLDELAAMSDEELMTASTQRVGTDIEKLTRRNMKECVAEHIQTLCLDDLAFARKVMHPRKSMIHCIWYINRKAREFIEQEMKDNDFPKENGVYGGDVPDDLCYQWAVDYFNDPDAKEDHEEDEKFVPQPYRSTATAKSKKSKGSKDKASTNTNAKTAKDSTPKTPPAAQKKQSDSVQLTFGDFLMPEEKAG